MRGMCDVCGRPASYRVRLVENGRQRGAELCDQHYEQINDQRRTASPLDSLFGHNPADDMIERMFGRSTHQHGDMRNLGDRESVDIETVLTEDSKDILQKAAALAQEHGAASVDTEHVLHALTGNTVVQSVLDRFKLAGGDIRQHIEHNYLKRSDAEAEKSDDAAVHISPRVKSALGHALTASRQFGHAYVGPEHILMGLMDLGEGRAFDLLSAYGLTPESLRQKAAKTIGLGPDAEKTQQSETPKLDEFSRDLTALAKSGELDPVIGRSKEIGMAIEVLARRSKNNPVLIGEPGVGKTAIAEGLAQRIANDDVPDVLAGKRLLELNINAMVAGAKYRGEFEERTKAVIDEIAANKDDVIIFIDEVHTIMGAGQGGGEGGLDMANVMKPAMARGDLNLIAATTLSEYQKHIEKDAALERRFQPVFIAEPTIDQTITILRGLRDKYEAHHKVEISEEAIMAAAELSDRYITNRFLPDKAIDLVDVACARVRISATTRPQEIQDLEAEIADLTREKEAADRQSNTAKGNETATRIAEATTKIKELETAWNDEKSSDTPCVRMHHVAEVVSNLTGVPVSELTAEEREKLLKLEDQLHERVIGQEEAVEAVSLAVRLARSGLQRGNKPVATFLFLGPTGVGKTELAKALAGTVYGDEDAMVRLDMSEYMERHAVARLIGAPPGYVGYEEGGQLTERVRRRPHTVILLDEIEKAHPDAHNILLQLFDDGRLTDGKGRVVDFTNAIIIATSNVGAHLIQENLTKDEAERSDYEGLKEKLMGELGHRFRPEFLNRLDEIIVFHALTKEQIRQIVELQLQHVIRTAHSQGVELTLTDAAIDYLADIGYRPEFGARELKRQIRTKVEGGLATLLLEKNYPRGAAIKAEFDKKTSKITFEATEPRGTVTSEVDHHKSAAA